MAPPGDSHLAGWGGWIRRAPRMPQDVGAPKAEGAELAGLAQDEVGTNPP